MRFFVELGPGYWLSSITAVRGDGRLRRLRDGRADCWHVTAPPRLRAYQREQKGKAR